MYAFPSGHNPKTGTQESGMTLRDYFAAQAMTSMVDLHGLDEFGYINGRSVALTAYLIADEMLKARDL
jgi:hypothetical protein